VGRRLFAFATAWRQANAKAVSELAAALNVEETRLFGSMTIQHLVDPIRHDPAPILSWHVDSWASAVHLSLSLKGQRSLGVSLAEGESDLTMCAGDVYLSSPALFAHEVRKQENVDVVAVQMRIALPTALEPGAEK
ncbi:unnamed protein product, partial [Effrenium voratum]